MIKQSIELTEIELNIVNVAIGTLALLLDIGEKQDIDLYALSRKFHNQDQDADNKSQSKEAEILTLVRVKEEASK